jgi:sugar lactone lactonase YvrE
MTKKYWFIIYTFLCIIVSANAQNATQIGDWKSYLPYRIGRYVAQSDENIYYATPFSVFSIHKQSNEIEYLTKTDGLSGLGISVIAHNQAFDVLIIGYNDGNIDLVKPKSIVNLPFIQKTNSVTGNKRIHHIFTTGDAAYISCDFGIVKINLQNEEVAFTTFTSVKVNQTTIFQNTLYAATESGIYSVLLNNITNVTDFRNWKRLDFPTSYSSNAVASFNNILYANINKSLYKINNNLATKLLEAPNYTVKSLSEGRNNLLIGLEQCFTNIQYPYCVGKIVRMNAQEKFTTCDQSCNALPVNAIEDEKGKIWMGDEGRGIRSSAQCGYCNQQEFNSPFSQFVTDLSVRKNELWMASGGVSPAFSYLYRMDGSAMMKDGKWTIFNHQTNKKLAEQDKNNDFYVRDMYKIALHPNNNKAYIGTFYGGLVEIDGEKTTVFDDRNSPLRGASGDEARERIGGLALDKNGNLWMSNSLANNPIALLKKDGTWRSFTAPNNGTHQVTIDSAGNKWFTLTNGNILVYNEGQNIDSPSDDKFQTLDASNNIKGRANCVTVDLDGEVWVGNSEGVTIFNCGSNIFTATCKGERRKVKFGEVGAYLLETEDVRCIAIDGANRKWIGTTNGVFALSADGKEQIHFFNTNNSPLFDNTIFDIAINDETGEVFIATGKGIISYRGEAIKGGTVNSTEVYAYPNPVRPDYTGNIVIKGLARDANVKITDINGRLVYETRSLGGQAIWDGRDYNGRKVASGVYLVLSTAVQGLEVPDAVVTKVVVVN